MDSLRERIEKNLNFSELSKASILMITWPLQRYVIINQTRTMQTKPLPYDSIFSYSAKSPFIERFGGFRGCLPFTTHYFASRALKSLIFPIIIKEFSYKRSNNLEERLIKESTIISLSHLLCGICLYPLERATVLVSCEIGYKGQNLRYRNCVTCLGNIFDVEGIGGLYKGFMLKFCHFSTAILISHFIDYYLSITKYFDQPVMKLISSVGSLAIGSFISYPILILARRRQLSDGKIFVKDPSYFPEQVTKIWKEEGFRGFYRGVIMSGFKGSVFTSLLFYIS